MITDTESDDEDMFDNEDSFTQPAKNQDPGLDKIHRSEDHSSVQEQDHQRKNNIKLNSNNPKKKRMMIKINHHQK